MLTKSPASRFVRNALAAALFVSLAAALPAAAWSAPTASDTPPEVQKAIERVLQERVSSLLSERNADGKYYKRGSYSKLFHKVDDSTYTAGFKVDTAQKDHMVTERYKLTLTKGGADSWSVTDEKLEDTYAGLYRAQIDDQKCQSFDTFSLSREGLAVKGTKGSVCTVTMQGKPVGLSLNSTDLSYDYTPPVEEDRALYDIYKKERTKELIFDPKFAYISCDPGTCETFLTTAFTGLTDATRDQIDADLARQIDKRVKETDDDISQNPFSGYRRPDEPDRRRYTIYLEAAGMGDNAIWLTSDSYSGREVTFNVTGLGGSVLGSAFNTPLFAYYSEQTRASNIDPAELERRPDAESRDYDLYSLVGSVEMGFGDGETLTGDFTYGLTTKRALKELPFAIARIDRAGDEKKEIKNPVMTINALQDGDGNDLTWVRLGPYTGMVILPNEVPAGTKLTMRIDFENRGSIYKVSPSYSYVDRGGWLPFVRFGDFIDTFDMTVRVPSRYTTLGIGHKESEETEDGANVTRWVAKSPVSFPTVIFGQYYEESAGFKVKKADGTEVPVTIHVDKNSMADWQIAPKALKKFADDAANSLNLYGKIFGVDYPYSKLDLVNDPAPAFYGQAPSSIVYLGSPTFMSKGRLGSLVGSQLTKFTDSLVPHEVAHQWWGSLVANSNFRNYWFVESLAEYSAALFIENAYGRDSYQQHIDDWRREILQADMRGRVQDNYTVWQGPGGFAPFRAAIYAKGPYAFHIMRSTWGDEAFFKFLKSLAQEMAGKEIVTRDIQMVAEKTFGANLDWFFNQWLRGVGLPEFTFTYGVRTAEDGSILVEGTVEQQVMLKPAMSVKEVLNGRYFTGIVPITIVTKSGKEYRKRLIIEGKTTPFKFAVPEKPKDIIFNRDGDELAYDVVVRTAS